MLSNFKLLSVLIKFRVIIKKPLFSNAKCADIVEVSGFCDCNGTAKAEEYHRQFPSQRVSNHHFFATVLTNLRENGVVPSTDIRLESNRYLEPQVQNILNIVNENPRVSTSGISTQ